MQAEVFLDAAYAIALSAPNDQYQDQAMKLRTRMQFEGTRLVTTQGLIAWVKNTCGWLLEIVKRNRDATGFQLLPRRWVVEQTFGWFGHYRRLSKDYEFQTDTSENMVLIAMSQLMVHRLTRNGPPAIPC